MRTKAAITTMIKMLLDYSDEAVSERDKEIVAAQVDILSGSRQIADFDNEKRDMRNAVKVASKWVNGQANDEDLFR